MTLYEDTMITADQPSQLRLVGSAHWSDMSDAGRGCVLSRSRGQGR